MEVKQHIIDEATAMFIEQGIKSVRMDDIASRCGISKRTLYEMFVDREDLIKQCLEYHFDSNGDFKNMLPPTENVIEEFWLVFSKSRDFRRINIGLMNSLCRYYPAVLKEFIKEHHEKMYSNSLKKLQQGVDEGLIMPQLDLNYFARALTNYIYGLTLIDANADLTSTRIEPETFRRAVIIFLRGITTEKGRRYIDNKLLFID